MDERTSGLVLRTRPLTETSLIVHWLTPDLGRIATVAKGARRSKSPFRGKLDLFYHAEISFARSRVSELHTLREIRLLATHEKLRRDLSSLEQISYFARLIEQTTETESPVPEIFKLFSGALSELIRHLPNERTVLAFEFQLLDLLGLMPPLAQSRLSRGSIQIAERLAKSSWEDLRNLKPSRSQILELSRYLRAFMIHHLGRAPSGRSKVMAEQEKRDWQPSVKPGP